ncbi:unnamed protein product [Notodromas monacha]|uniref:RRM domain-containing protein n=1 Tax=Notodromas monacha TaxID=399045 RepID=A0A7R9BY71_9CRUS|nr:unnamed protein product [Notodromas monacha]CAG0923927.1 unnamed protein product [Notodromas monacha]
MSLFEAVCGLESQQMSSSSGAIDDTLASQLEQEVSIAQDNFGPALEPPDSADHWQIYAEGFDEHRWSNPQIHPIFNDAFSPTSGDSSDQTWFPVHAYAYEANQTGDGHTEHTWRQIQMEGNHGDLGEHAATSSARGNAGYAMNYHIQDLVSQDRIKAQSLEHQQQQQQNHLNLSSADPGLPHNQQSRPLLYNFDSTGLLLACHTAESRPATPFPTPNNRVNGFSFVQPTSFPEQQPAFEPSPVSGFVRAPPPVYHVRPMVQVAKPVPRAVIMNQAGILGPYPGHQHSNQSSRSCSPMLPMYSPGHGLDQPYTSTYSGATAANHGNNKITDSLLANRALVEYYSAAHRSYSQVTPNFVIEPPDDHFASIPLIETGALKLSLPNLRMPPPKPQIPSKAYRIWMDGIKWKTTELDFWIYFMAHYGSVLSVKILKRNRRKDHRNGGGDGLKENIDPLDVSDEAFEKLDFGFVEVAEESIAKRIIRDLGGLGYRVRHATELPIDPKAVHLKNLPMSMDSKGLADFIRSQGLEGIDTVKVLRQPANRLSASAFIRFLL